MTSWMCFVHIGWLVTIASKWRQISTLSFSLVIKVPLIELERFVLSLKQYNGYFIYFYLSISKLNIFRPKRTTRTFVISVPLTIHKASNKFSDHIKDMLQLKINTNVFIFHSIPYFNELVYKRKCQTFTENGSLFDPNHLL